VEDRVLHGRLWSKIERAHCLRAVLELGSSSLGVGAFLVAFSRETISFFLVVPFLVAEAVSHWLILNSPLFRDRELLVILLILARVEATAESLGGVLLVVCPLDFGTGGEHIGLQSSFP
jgi:hypothetical protein